MGPPAPGAVRLGAGAYHAIGMDVRLLVAEIDAELKARGGADRAAHEKAYLGSELEHYGTTVPAVRAVSRAVGLRGADLGHDSLLALVEGLWSVPVHERRLASVELLKLHVEFLECRDVPVFEQMLRESRTWALLDGLAASVLGPLFERCPDSRATLDRWAADSDFWLRRAALLALLPALKRGPGDFERFSRYADSMLDEQRILRTQGDRLGLAGNGEESPGRSVRMVVAQGSKSLRSDSPRGGQAAFRTATNLDPRGKNDCSRCRNRSGHRSQEVMTPGQQIRCFACAQSAVDIKRPGLLPVGQGAPDSVSNDRGADFLLRTSSDGLSCITPIH